MTIREYLSSFARFDICYTNAIPTRERCSIGDDFQYNPPQKPWLDIVYQDRDMVVIDKPSGLLSVPGRYHSDSALRRVQESFSTAYAVHRLDMDTSGLLILALRRKAERELQRQFRERLVEKRYIAIVQGHPHPTSGEINLPLIRCKGSPPRSRVDHEIGRPAQTQYQTLDTSTDCATLALVPKTGRSHQLRIHLASIGHSIVGDRFYGAVSASDTRLLLHATFLSFLHPHHGQPCSFYRPPPF